MAGVDRVPVLIVDVIDVVAVCDRLVPATRAVLVGVLLVAGVRGRTALVPVAVVTVVHVALVEEILVAGVYHVCMAALSGVLVCVVRVSFVLHLHSRLLSWCSPV
jgi:hypothetical protein